MSTHTFFIAAAYAVTAFVVGGLALRAVLDHRTQARALEALEARGVNRRSRPKASPRPDGERSAQSAG
ncbi:heme exporter protein CcmD [Microvirga alba]|uniref:Heme exporter protein D n=1 Tax=Microvirga alba TaxID=2791025 RepID=A0A931BSL8_9HYPH|nr:heme exporter protein CcmD [Microvirga alba]MBF9233050.1 heme exporter protein CcmD [Microvirga alba]